MKLTFRKAGAPVTEKDVVDLERHLHYSLPADYRAFLLDTNGGEQPDREVFSIEDGNETLLKTLYSLGGPQRPDLRAHIEFRSGEVAPDLIPIGQDAFGNGLYMGISGDRRAEIYFHYHDRGKADLEGEFDPVFFVAACFEDFVRNLKAKPKALKDEIELLGERGGRADLLQYLGRGNSLEKLNKYNRTLAQEAGRYGNLKFLQACHEHGRELKGVAHFAAMNGHQEVIDWLLAHGTDVNERNRDGKTILSKVGFRYKELSESLKKRGAVE